MASVFLSRSGGEASGGEDERVELGGQEKEEAGLSKQVTEPIRKYTEQGIAAACIMNVKYVPQKYKTKQKTNQTTTIRKQQQQQKPACKRASACSSWEPAPSWF